MNEDTAAVETTDSVDAFERLSPSTLRAQREELKVSRATLQKATGLSSSVIWRAEQDDAKPVTDEEYMKIYNVLIEDWTVNGVPAEYVKVTKTHAVSSTDAAEAWQAAAWKAREVISEAHTLVLEQIKEAQAKKASTKGLKALAEVLKAECVACSSAEH